jgi:hypothetical protein
LIKSGTRKRSPKEKMIALSVGAIRVPRFARACFHFIEQGGAMSGNFRSIASAILDDKTGIESQNVRERVVTVLATSLAMLIVGAIAVLMGMA